MNPAIRNLCLCLAAVPCTLAASSAKADSVLDFTVSSVTIQAFSAAGNREFDGPTHTGWLELSVLSTRRLSADIDGVGLRPFSTPMELAGRIDLVDGRATGGSFTLTLAPGLANTDTYTATILPGNGTICRPADDLSYAMWGWQLSGLTADGRFSDPMFGKLDVTQWFEQQPLAGSFMKFEYHPDASGYDTGAEMQISVTPMPLPTANPVPLPAAVWAGFGLLGALFAWRRWRLRRDSF